MKRNNGFTIVELLTVMAIIAVLIGLMVPALGLVRDFAQKISQKAQFHGIDAGLELYKTEFGSYPASSDNLTTGKEASSYCGANKLAEAMVGLDFLGFHPNSDFRSDGMNTVTDTMGVALSVNVYDTAGVYANWQTAQQNIDSRKGPFVVAEKAKAFRLDQIYTDASRLGTAGFGANYNPTGAANSMYPLVLCDVYAHRRGGVGGRKTGTPILYFRANSSKKFQDSTVDSNGSGSAFDDDIYDYRDNQSLLNIGTPDEGNPFTIVSALVTGDPLQEFDNMIRNEDVTTVRRPYNADSYILISAGKDGDFGTADDVFNFEKEEE